MEESSPRVDPDIEKVRKTGKRISLTSAFRRFYLQQNLDQIPWKKFALELFLRSFSVAISS